MLLEKVTFDNDLDVSENLLVKNKSNFENDVSMGTHLQVVGDVSFESNLDISENLHVFNNTILDGSVTFGSSFVVNGDVSFESNLDVSENLLVKNKSNFENDVSMGTHLQVIGDVSFESNLDVSENLHVFNQSIFDNTVNMNSTLGVVGKGTFENDIDISENLLVKNKSNFENDVSMGTHLQVVGDVSFENNLDVSENLHVFNQSTFDKAVNMNNTLGVVGKVTLDNDLDVSNNLLVKNNARFKKRVDFDDNVYFNKTADSSGIIVLNGTSINNNNRLYINDDDDQADINNDDTYNIVTNKIKSNNLYVSGTIEANNIQPIGGFSAIMNSLIIKEDNSNNQIGSLEVSGNTTINGGTIQIDGNTSIQNNLTIGDTNDITDTVLNICANSGTGNGINYKGDVIIGANDSSNNLTVFGDLRIKNTSKLIIEDPSYSIVDLETRVMVTDILDISNSGSGPTINVRQYDTSTEDIAHFYDGDDLVVSIEADGDFMTLGKISIGKDLSNDNIKPEYSLDISATDAILLPVGDDNNRPLTTTNGLMRYNTGSNQFEGYSNGWQGLGGVVDPSGTTFISATAVTDNLVFNVNDSRTILMTDQKMETGIHIDMCNNAIYNVNKLGIGLYPETNVNSQLDVVGDIHLTGTLTSDSDCKIKDNITQLIDTLENIDKLGGYTYTRLDLNDNKTHIGVIAQEVENIYPELVVENPQTNIKSVNYCGLSAILIECVKELKYKNKLLETRLSKIEEKINNL